MNRTLNVLITAAATKAGAAVVHYIDLLITSLKKICAPERARETKPYLSVEGSAFISTLTCTSLYQHYNNSLTMIRASERGWQLLR